MMFNTENDGKRKPSKALILYVLKHSNLQIEELEELSELVSGIDDEEFEYRIKTIVDFFERAQTDKWKNRIHSEFKYAKSVINSDSFFENQRWVSTIPTVEETEQYLKERREADLKNPGVSSDEFHHNVLKVKRLYQDSELFELDKFESGDEKNKQIAQREYAIAFDKIDDEEVRDKLDGEIKNLYKQFTFCELEYRLFRNTLTNIFLFQGREKYQQFKSALMAYDTITISDLIRLRHEVLHSS